MSGEYDRDRSPVMDGAKIGGNVQRVPAEDLDRDAELRPG